jgi:hypothetical protein
VERRCQGVAALLFRINVSGRGRSLPVGAAIVPDVSHGFLHSLQANVEEARKINYDSFFISFQFIFHYLSCSLSC